MITPDSIKDKIRALLIAKEGDVQPHELKGITEEAKQIGLTKEQIARLVPEIDRQINWEQVRKDKEQEEELKRKNQEEAEKKMRQIAQAADLLDDLIQLKINDGIVEKGDLVTIFNNAKELFQDTTSLSRKIKAKFEANKFRPFPSVNLNASNLEEMLTSTNWYNDKEYEKVNPPPKPQAPTQTTYTPPKPEAPTQPIYTPPPPLTVQQKSKSSASFIAIIVIMAAVFAGVYLYTRNESSSGEGYYNPGRTSVTPSIDTIPSSPSNEVKNAAPNDQNLKLKDNTEQEELPQKIEKDIESDPAELENEKNSIISTLKEYYSYENESDISSVLDYYEYPLEKYYDKTNVSRDELAKLYNFYYTVNLNNHKTIIDWDMLEFKKTIEGFAIVVKGTYSYSTKASPESAREAAVNDMIIVNNQHKIISVSKNKT